jgi:hypothetical protein
MVVQRTTGPVRHAERGAPLCVGMFCMVRDCNPAQLQRRVVLFGRLWCFAESGLTLAIGSRYKPCTLIQKDKQNDNTHLLSFVSPQVVYHSHRNQTVAVQPGSSFPRLHRSCVKLGPNHGNVPFQSNCGRAQTKANVSMIPSVRWFGRR